MKKIKIYSYCVLFLMVFTVLFINLYEIRDSPSIIQEQDSEGFNNYGLRSSNNNSIITINNNSDLKQTATSGNGSESNPYLIENKKINGNGSLYCILINNTNKFFILKDCMLYNSTYGLVLHNVSNGYIAINFIYENLKSGIYIENSFNNTILSNMAFNNKKHGILLVNSNFTEIKSNTLYSNNIIGIFVNNSLYNNITANIVDYHDYPIFLHSSNHTFVINNTGYGNKKDIEELNCDNTNHFEGNNFKKIFCTREEGDDNNNTNKDTIIIDFTLILLICVGVFGLALLTKLININAININAKNIF